MIRNWEITQVYTFSHQKVKISLTSKCHMVAGPNGQLYGVKQAYFVFGGWIKNEMVWKQVFCWQAWREIHFYENPATCGQGPRHLTDPALLDILRPTPGLI